MAGNKKLNDYMMSQTKEQLVIFLSNADYIEDILRDKLFLITGCRAFGSSDGMNGVCVECQHNNPEMEQRCFLFGQMTHEYRMKK